MRRSQSLALLFALTGLAACSGSGDASSGSGGASGTPTGTTSGSPTTASSGTGGGNAPGWLYTKGNKIYVSGGAAGDKPWMGRGVNMDDIYFCGYNNTLWMMSADETLKTIASGVLDGWKPNFIRMSLSMASDPKVTSFLSNEAEYKTPMTGVINAIGSHPGVYVLVTLRSDASMIGQDMADGDPEATGLPSDSTTTPDKNAFPTGTDATYKALVDTFAHSSFVLFGLTNEPGGNKLSDDQIAKAMEHAVGVIRAEEDALGVPHHIVSVQGNGWTSNISHYAKSPIAHDNVVYEVHGYPPSPSSYTYDNLPVVIGEYGSLADSAAFFADLEAKQIPNLAWDFDPYNNCSPDLVNVTGDASKLEPSDWGMTVKSYLLAHASP
jgi:hypothetical protein